MILPDTNLLLYAFRPELPEHPSARKWLQAVIDSGEILVMHPLVYGAFLRLSTRQLGPIPPAPVELSIRFLSTLDGARIAETENHDRVLSRLGSTHGILGDGIVDAWLASFAITHGIQLASHDKAFSRFAPELEWFDPIPSAS